MATTDNTLRGLNNFAFAGHTCSAIGRWAISCGLVVRDTLFCVAVAYNDERLKRHENVAVVCAGIILSQDTQTITKVEYTITRFTQRTISLTAKFIIEEKTAYTIMSSAIGDNIQHRR